jgi:hypothetical protein
MTMKTNRSYPRVPTRFGREIRFELAPNFERLRVNSAQKAMEQLKTRLLQPVLDETPDPTLRRQMQLAANEAAALACTTAFPLLVLPVLLEEKAAELQHYAAHQEHVHQASSLLISAEAAV